MHFHPHTLTPSSPLTLHPQTLTPSPSTHPHRVSDASGSLEVTPVGKYPLKREMLDTKVGVANVWHLMHTASCER